MAVLSHEGFSRGRCGNVQGKNNMETQRMYGVAEINQQYMYEQMLFFINDAVIQQSYVPMNQHRIAQ